MKSITNEMIKEFNMKKLSYDFMGYNFKNTNDLSFHHLIVAKKNCKDCNLGDGYYKWNGAILVQNTSHDYLHLIEKKDKEIFYKITSEMIDENLKGKIDVYNLKKIRDLLIYFEKEYENKKNNKGKLLIKREFVRGRIDL